jgi:hypothetical protein
VLDVQPSRAFGCHAAGVDYSETNVAHATARRSRRVYLSAPGLSVVTRLTALGDVSFDVA